MYSELCYLRPTRLTTQYCQTSFCTYTQGGGLGGALALRFLVPWMMWRTSSKWITTISYRLRRLERPSGITLPSTMSRPWSAQEFSRTRSCCNHIIIAYNVLLVVANGQLHVSAPGKRFDRYPELVQEAFGPRLGYWIVLPQQLLVQIASDLVYSVSGGNLLKNPSSL
ncbi:hypothetical protein YC2023_016651 [Brassica napus]